MQTLEKFIPARSPSDKPQKVPRKIFQTHETNVLPERMINVGCRSWIDKNPDYEYHFYDNEDRLRLIKEHFEPRVLEAYLKLTNGAMKSDIFRYCVIYLYAVSYTHLTLPTTPYV